MARLLGSILVVFVLVSAVSAEVVLTWTFPQGFMEELGIFTLYVRRDGATYDYKQPAYAYHPPDRQGFCSDWPIFQVGQWHVVMRSLDHAGEPSVDSEEVSFYWDPQHGCTLTPRDSTTPTVPPSPPIATPAPPGPIPHWRSYIPPAPKRSTEPLPSKRGPSGSKPEWASETCIWKGTLPCP